MFRLEREMYVPITEGARRYGYRLFRIEDGGGTKKPCDIVGVHQATGLGVLVEAKVLKTKGAIEHRIEAHQVTWGKYFGENGIALFPIGYQSNEEPDLYAMRSDGDLIKVCGLKYVSCDKVIIGWPSPEQIRHAVA